MARRGSSRTNRRAVSYDPRTGFKVKGRRLKEDGELPEFYTTDPDEVNPGRWPVNPGPDGLRFRPGLPENSNDGVTINATHATTSWQERKPHPTMAMRLSACSTKVYLTAVVVLAYGGALTGWGVNGWNIGVWGGTDPLAVPPGVVFMGFGSVTVQGVTV